MKTAHLFFLALSLVIFSGCQTTSSTGKAKQSGFLRDYSMLGEGEGDQASLVYISQETDFSKYKKVILEPVTVWRSGESKLSELEASEVKELTDYLYSAAHGELSKHYQIVKDPGADVMRIRIALTEAVGANVAMNSVSTVVPIGLVSSTTKKLATGSHAFVGKASVEVEILDTITNTRIVAAVDERAGRKNPIGGKWGDAKSAFDYWAGRLASRLQQLERGNNLEESFRNLE